MGGTSLWELLARAIRGSGTERHIDGLIDLIGADIPHDLVTVTRYSASKSPEFLKHRRYSNEMVRKYLSIYYVFDPFYAHWRRTKRAGIVPLKTLADDAVKRGQYIAEFLAQSSICDEVGILIEDGGDWCIGIFLDRTSKPFRESEIALLRERLPVFQALHARDVEPRGAHFQRSTMAPGIGVRPKAEPALPVDLWPQLSPRERQLVQLILAGHPNATIAQRLGIQVGTVKNHRLRIYAKLDITTERELFLEFFQHSNQER